MGKSTLLGIACAFLFCLFVTGAASAGAVVDQYQLDGTQVNQAIQSYRKVGQTFTVGHDGLLSGLELSLYETGSNGDLTLKILDMSGGDVNSATILGSVSISETELGPAPTTLDLGSVKGTFFDLSSLEIISHAGDQLAFILSTTRELPNYYAIRTAAFSSNYDRGANFVTNHDDVFFGDGDTAFKTYVDTAVMVAIDIKPGKAPNIINLKSGGFIPVAILTEGEFDALQVDPDTTKFGPNETKSVRYKVKDVDKDGDADLLMYFRIQQTDIACSDTRATLTGELYNGTPFTGTDSVQTKNCQ